MNKNIAGRIRSVIYAYHFKTALRESGTQLP
jgi:hypothetical protein